MKMTRFRIQNYKKLRDSGWVSCDDMTVFVGKNEAGKSSVFRCLSKLNPSDGEKFDGLKEFPRSRYTSEFKMEDWPVVSGEFALSEEDKAYVTGFSRALAQVTSVTCTRHYSGSLEVEFSPAIDFPEMSNAAFLARAEVWRKSIGDAVAPEGRGDSLARLKSVLLMALSQKVEELKAANPGDVASETAVGNLHALVVSQLNEQWQKTLLDPIAQDMGRFVDALVLLPQLNRAGAWVEANMPKFVFFDSYDVLDSSIHIPTYLSQLTLNPDGPRLRATKALFQHVGLDINALQGLDPSQAGRAQDDLKRFADERHIQMASASAEMTEKFSKWWDQRKHSFRYSIDGPFFRVWVSDDLDPSEIELDQRSGGMQYFFSFYLVFLEEAKGAYNNSILLLDEAGIQLHGAAQQRIVTLLERLSKDNQLFYSTHSPFMIDGNRLDRVRVVYEDPLDGTSKVSVNGWPKDRDSVFPLRAALGYAVTQSLFRSGKQLIVDDVTDYLILNAMSELLIKKGKQGLRNDIVVVPSGGASDLVPLATTMAANSVSYKALLDGSASSLNKGDVSHAELLEGSFLVSKYTKDGGTGVEDMFPELYLKAVSKAYPKASLQFNESEAKMTGVTKKVDAIFARTGAGKFERWRAGRLVAEWIFNKSGDVPDSSKQAFERLFNDINKGF
ncbi:MAG: ATP-binding protein [Thaumarchaeota archaeon]|nr:ATP-binding protein [Nitrososphaerota archaeon]